MCGSRATQVLVKLIYQVLTGDASRMNKISSIILLILYSFDNHYFLQFNKSSKSQHYKSNE